jgi:ATP/maltotriose-dependent transcriptional regulator MalT
VWLSELLSFDVSSLSEKVRARALSAAGFLAAYQGDLRSAEDLLTGALVIWRRLGDGRGVADVLVSLGVSAQSQNDFARAEVLYEEAISVARQARDPVNVYWALNQLASVALHAGQVARARALIEDSLALKQIQGDRYGIAMSVRDLAHVAWMTGDYERAAELAQQSLVDFSAMHHWRGTSTSLLLLAHVTAESGELERAATLYGAAKALHKAIGDRRSGEVLLNTSPGHRELGLAAVRRWLAPAVFEAASAAGEAMTMAEAAAFALRTTPTSRPRQRVSVEASRRPPLSQREIEVLQLVAAGNSNRQIASSLVLSERTVERHIANVYAKVGLRNRAEATAYALRNAT